MNVLILCEGVIDGDIIGNYLEACFGVNPKQSHIKIFKKEENKGIYKTKHYEKEENTIDVVSVGGHNFSEAVSIVLNANKVNADVFFDYLAVFSDRDSEDEIKEVWDNIKSIIVDKTKSGFEIIENDWIKMEQPVDFEGKKTINLLLVPIPLSEDGALESVLLDSLADEPGNEYVVDQSKNFVNALIKAKKSISPGIFKNEYLKKRSSMVKAPLAVFFAIISPDRAYNMRRSMMKSFDWHGCFKMKEIFNKIEELDF